MVRLHREVGPALYGGPGTERNRRWRHRSGFSDSLRQSASVKARIDPNSCCVTPSQSSSVRRFVPVAPKVKVDGSVELQLGGSGPRTLAEAARIAKGYGYSGRAFPVLEGEVEDDETDGFRRFLHSSFGMAQPSLECLTVFMIVDPVNQLQSRGRDQLLHTSTRKVL